MIIEKKSKEGISVKPLIGFKENQTKIRRILDALMQQASFVPRKTMRIRPRNADETMALCRAVEKTVREAKQSGCLRRTTAGYVISWKH